MLHEEKRVRIVRRVSRDGRCPNSFKQTLALVYLPVFDKQQKSHHVCGHQAGAAGEICIRENNIVTAKSS